MFFKCLGFTTHTHTQKKTVMTVVLQKIKEKSKLVFLGLFFYTPIWFSLFGLTLFENRNCMCSALVHQLFDLQSLYVLTWYCTM